MDFLERGYLRARGPYDYTFNFWTDYLGLTTLVTNSGRPNPNSITESLKATLGLDDAPPCPCPCVEGARLECCCPDRDRDRDPEPGSPPPASILDLKQRFSLLGPFHGPDRDSGLGSGFELFGAERRTRKAASRAKQEPKICVFCRNNGAPEEVYGSHVLKSPDGRVLCPILRAYTCPLCAASGDSAHTIKYCPLSREPRGGRAVGGKRLRLF